jgi:serine/threonine-protein kinase mTOR
VVLRTRDERGSGFNALGEMAGALGGELVPYLPTITNYLREAVFHTLSFCMFCLLQV